MNAIAGVRTGSPQRKNESTIFAHLPDTYDRDTLKRKDLADIPKPKVVGNNLSAQKLSAYGGGSFADPSY